jgi:prevent-host-death family protein
MRIAGGNMARPTTLNIAEAKARLAELVQRAARGEEIIIARNGEPQARLVPLEPKRARVPGKGSGQWRLADDFNDPLPPDLVGLFDGDAG